MDSSIDIKEEPAPIFCMEIIDPAFAPASPPRTRKFKRVLKSTIKEAKKKVPKVPKASNRNDAQMICDICPPDVERRYRFSREVHIHQKNHHPVEFPKVWLHYILCSSNLLKLHSIVSSEDSKGFRTVGVTCPFCKRFCFNARFAKPKSFGHNWKGCMNCKSFMEPLENHLWSCQHRVVSKAGRSPKEFSSKCSTCGLSFMRPNNLADHLKKAHNLEMPEADNEALDIDKVKVKLSWMASAKIEISKVEPKPAKSKK